MYTMVLLAALSTTSTAPACHGCRGGCWGCYGCCGCYGGCYGCYGGCWGCYGCYGGGCYGGCYGCYGGCYGCYGCGGYYGAGYGVAYAAPVYGSNVQPLTTQSLASLESGFRPASLTVQLPEDAKLFVDNKPMKTASSTRTFRTPALQPGQTYYYDLRAEVLREGRVVDRTQRVLVRAGENVTASFADLGADADRQALTRK
jgi:uncharacterized protein (TIGR03000 family)